MRKILSVAAVLVGVFAVTECAQAKLQALEYLEDFGKKVRNKLQPGRVGLLPSQVNERSAIDPVPRASEEETSILSSQQNKNSATKVPTMILDEWLENLGKRDHPRPDSPVVEVAKRLTQAYHAEVAADMGRLDNVAAHNLKMASLPRARLMSFRLAFTSSQNPSYSTVKAIKQMFNPSDIAWASAGLVLKSAQ